MVLAMPVVEMVPHLEEPGRELGSRQRLVAARSRVGTSEGRAATGLAAIAKVQTLRKDGTDRRLEAT